MVVLAGALFGLCLLWAFMTGLFRWLKDVALGPVNIWATGKAYRESERRSIEAQHRSYRLILRLWPVALTCLLAAIALVAVANH